ncbi:MAG TPA: c-type cytochrome [Thermoanaerobaculaceae bacterium]|mgnify:CR=1 FL=1|nr:c-type cytochrome [Thermoanaerobaculaceae bacterium]HPS77134.1 c-type cytochrome [Thermoanaerobaculaceae bacterium]
MGFCAVLGAAALLRGDALGDPLAAGRTLYRNGTLPSGAPVSAVVQGDVPMSGAQAACSSCHRRSGFGSNEGIAAAPPVVGALLYRPVAPVNRLIERPRAVALRSAYTDQTLARAIRDGVDPDGRPLGPMMPRFALDDPSMAALIGYLRSLSPGPDPGVEADTIHLAVVIAGEVRPARRQAVLEVMKGFTTAKNALTRREFDRRAYARRRGAVEYRAYRAWALHVWELTGPPATWERQLAAEYRAQPVFALVGGISDSTWAPVRQFCEQQGIPGLLPQVPVADASADDFYTVYFSRGLPLEGEVLARYLQGDGSKVKPILQVFRRDGVGEAGAEALKSSAGMATTDAVTLEAGQPLTPATWGEIASRCRGCDLVLWLRDVDLGGLAEATPLLGSAAHIVFSATLLGGDQAVPAGLRSRALLMYPYDLPDKLEDRMRRPMIWLRSQGLAGDEERVRVDTLFAATLAGEALKELDAYLSRDLLLERVEHMLESTLPTSSYPRLTLSPGDRFAAKGCFVVRPATQAGGKVTALSDWIVP